MALERIVMVYRLDSQISWDDILTSFFFFGWLSLKKFLKYFALISSFVEMGQY